jgi:hypothetical protein
MTYIIADTQAAGKLWAKTDLLEEPYKVFSTDAQLRGHAFYFPDDVYILTRNPQLLDCLLPALLGCRVFNGIK